MRLDAFDSATDLLNKYQGSFVIDEIQKSKPVLNKLKDKFCSLSLRRSEVIKDPLSVR